MAVTPQRGNADFDVPASQLGGSLGASGGCIREIRDAGARPCLRLPFLIIANQFLRTHWHVQDPHAK
ncbi:hypothetical protein CCP3SC1_400012 [Gammaproteobacteria bacterium]